MLTKFSFKPLVKTLFLGLSSAGMMFVFQTHLLAEKAEISETPSESSDILKPEAEQTTQPLEDLASEASQLQEEVESTVESEVTDEMPKPEDEMDGMIKPKPEAVEEGTEAEAETTVDSVQMEEEKPTEEAAEAADDEYDVTPVRNPNLNPNPEPVEEKQ